MKHKNSSPHTDDIAVLKKSVPLWKDVDNTCIEFRRLSGLTNITYQIKDASESAPPLVFKKFSIVEGLIER